ncbi:MAG: AAA family ATPase [Phormidesmis sp.]
MIPKQLKLQNFLSYREVVLDFDGLHVACVCGPNGAGKSSLLEAIAWCVWGQSRVNTEDDIVRQGAIEAQVSFCFVHDGQCYRIIRTRRRQQASTLEFQIQMSPAVELGPKSTAASASSLQGKEPTFRSLTQKGVRATQQYILRQLKIDYETFVNAAYLRQGRADEFMLKRPGDRKQVLADLLKLDRYDQLAEQAKEQARAYKAEILPLSDLLHQLTAKREAHADIQQRSEQLAALIKADKETHWQRQKKLAALKQQQQKRLLTQQQLALAQQHVAHQRATLTTSETALSEARQQLYQIEEVLSQAEEIEQRYEALIDLQRQESEQTALFHRYQPAQTERLDLQQRINQQCQQEMLQRSQLEAQLDQMAQQTQAALKILEKKEGIAEQLLALRKAKQKLRQLDAAEAESAPLRQRFQDIQEQIAQAHTRLVIQIEALDSQQMQMAEGQTSSGQLMQAAVEVAHKIAHLEQRRAYQEAVRQKGIERRSFMAQLQARQRDYEGELAQLAQTLQRLTDPDEAHCPVCEQALNGQTWESLRDRTTKERDDIQNQIWTIREQLAVSDSEIQVLRQEYRALEGELAKYATFLEERGQLKAKLASVDAAANRLQAMSDERVQLERCLQENDYAAGLQDESRRIEAQLETMAYDERNHALVRSQVERLRWSQIKYTEIKQAERQLAQIQAQRPQIEERLQIVRDAIAVATLSEEAQALQVLDRRISEINYSLEQHNQLREQLRTEQVWQTRHQTLRQAQAQKAALMAKLARLQAHYQQQTAAVHTANAAVEQLRCQLAEQSSEQAEKIEPNSIDIEIVELEAEITESLEQRDSQLSQLGRLQQQLLQLETVAKQQQEQQKKLEDIRHKYQVYRSLSEAFGRNGIQALMIENLLPQLEAMTNQLLGRLSDHQLHVQFVTQKTGRKSKKLIDTLDILIADVRGTRPYETYSGGEAFRVNFAIRLAIARLLALRSGTALQMLIVDEGFGTQDREGCDRLIAAIEAIAPDFSCILTITHMPHFREAFQTRIDVYKDEDGSHITIAE